MVTTFYPPYHFGGDAIYVYRLSNALAELGHQVDVVHDRDAYYLLHPGEPEFTFPNHPNITVYALKSRVGFLSPLATQLTGQPIFKGKLKAVLQSQHYEVIHFHNVSLIGLGAFAYGSAVKLQTLHEHWLICPLHVLWKFDREVCTRRQCLRCTLYSKRPPQLWRHTNFPARQLAQIDQFLSPSRFTRDKHYEFGLRLPIQVLPYFLPNHVDLKEPEVLPHPRPYFLFVGRLVKIKGLQTLIPLFNNYMQADLIIAGEGDYAPVLRELARELPNVQFVGAQSQAQLRALYRHAIAVIMPSICYEVFGIVLIESFALKTPVIVRDLGGMPEAVTDSNGGIIFRTEAELLQAIKCLQEDPELRRRLGENGYAAYLRLWSEEPHLTKYLELVESRVARRAAEAAQPSLEPTGRRE